MGFIGSPFLSPFVFGFLVARTRCVENLGVPVIELIPMYLSWRWAYGIGSLYGLVVVVLIALFMEETWVTKYFAFDYL
jgi:hypothetical protein